MPDSAPEVFMLQQGQVLAYDVQVDIFSFGFVLFEMLFGQHPFHHSLQLRAYCHCAIESD